MVVNTPVSIGYYNQGNTSCEDSKADVLPEKDDKGDALSRFGCEGTTSRLGTGIVVYVALR